MIMLHSSRYVITNCVDCNHYDATRYNFVIFMKVDNYNNTQTIL